MTLAGNGAEIAARLVPGRTDRVAFIGQTGSGKTTLARWLLQSRTYVVLLDVKGTISWPGYTLVKSLRAAEKLDPDEAPRIIYRPTYDELEDWSVLDRFFRWCYERGNCTVYIDETMGICNGDSFPRWYGACLTRGRESGVEVWSATQRPLRIPQVTLSEAEHVYTFRLRMPQDRARVEQLTAISQERIAALSKREFLYAPQDGAVLGPLVLELRDTRAR